MKTKKLIPISTLVLLSVLMITPAFANGNGEYVSTLYATDLLIDVGEVRVLRTTPGNLQITYEVNEGCYLLETHLEVVTDPADFPTTGKGNPKIGKFTYKTDPHDPMTTQFTYNVPVNPLDDTFFIAAHAVVDCPCIGEETAWGDTDGENMMYFGGGSWAFYFQFPPPP